MFRAIAVIAIAACGIAGADAEAQTLNLSPPVGTQLTTTFTVTGSGYTPNATVRRFVNQPTWGGFREISSIQSNGAGQITFLYTPDCTHPLGTAYLYAIDGPTGRQSPTVAETIQAHPSCTPSVSSVSPSTPVAGPNDQPVTVFGANFQTGLTVTVSWPGGSSTLSGTQIQSVSSSSFVMVITLGGAGQYTIRVNNPNLTQSNQFTFTAGSPPPPPPPQSPTLGISPSVGTQLTTLFTATGSNYTPNGTVRRFVNQPSWGGFREISTVQANGAGQISFPYTPDCTNAPGVSHVYAIDAASGRQSSTATQTIQANPVCTVTVSGISPAAPVAGLQDQAVTVYGSNFQNGLTVTVGFANGGPVTLSGAQIQNVATTSFVMLITLGAPGTFTIQVNNPNGSRSNVFSFEAGQTSSPAPQITGVNPQRPIVNDLDQAVTVYGQNFASGLSVEFTFPNGSPGGVAGGQIPSVTPTALTMLARLGNTGDYRIRVRNPGGQLSNEFIFTVDPVVPTTGTIEGRVLSDTNANGAQDTGEPFFKAPGLSCNGVARADVGVAWTGPVNGNAPIDTCVSGAPYFRIPNLPQGSYTVSVTTPAGWRSTFGSPRTVAVTGGTTAPRVDFRIASGGSTPPPPVNSTDLGVSVTHDIGRSYELARQEESVSFILSVRNHGPNTATGTAITFFPPAALAFEDVEGASGACTPGGTSVQCPVRSLTAGASQAIVAKFRALKAGRHTFSTTVRAAEGESNAANNEASLVAEIVPPFVQPFDPCQLRGVGPATPLDPAKPTIVLTHGWMGENDPPDELWSSGQELHAKRLILDAVGSRANVVQVFWPAARTGRSPQNSIQYAKARSAAEDAGSCIAIALYVELRGRDYAQPIQFIGHSLGTVVNAHASREFLKRAERVPFARMTILDFPGRVFSPQGQVLAFAIASDNVPAGQFETELKKVPRIWNGQLPMAIDNYFSPNWDAFGKTIPLSQYVSVYNHKELQNPKDLDDFFDEDSWWGIVKNHSGVHKWFRLTISPSHFGISCPNEGAALGSLNPCQHGWRNSIMMPIGPGLPSIFDTADLTAGAMTAGDMTNAAAPPSAAMPAAAPATPLAFDSFTNIQDCELIDQVVTCAAGVESKASSVFDVPIGAKYLSFSYRFRNAGGNEYAGVYIDDQPVWVMAARNTTIDEFQSSGSIALPATSGRHTLSILYYGAGISGASFELKDLAIEEGVPEVAYLAEGATGPFFKTRIALMNPEPEPSKITLRFQREDGAQISHGLMLAGTARATVDVDTIPGLESANFATRIESSSQVVADRTMTWDASAYGSHTERSIASPSLIWYLAEGATHGNFTLFYLLQNPDPTRDADIEVKYLLGDGEPIIRNYSVPAGARMNILVDDEQGLEAADVSGVIRVRNNVPIIVERAMYLNRPGQLVAGGHDSAAVTEPLTHWFLAEGATGSFFDLFVLIANPYDVAADVKITYLLPSGQTVVKTHNVRANSRFTINVAYEDPLLASTPVSATLESINGVPVIVERTMWWPAGDWQEGHNSPGATSTGTRWAIAEGEEGGDRQTQTYILIANTSASAGTAKVTLMFEDGTTLDRIFPLNPSSRFNVAVALEFPEAVGRRFGAVVESLGAPPAEIVVERAIYSNANGSIWAAGSNALATKLQ